MGIVSTTRNTDGSTSSITQRFSYDANGTVVALNYNGTYYYYIRNAVGDIVGLIDKTGTTVVSYTYDSWGKLLSTTGSKAGTLGANQPFRYRGYVYDNETGWYYLQSRYYNPEIGRFISADVLLSTGQGVLGHNAYAYCLNNPINRSDRAGTISIADILDFFREMAEGAGGGSTGGSGSGNTIAHNSNNYSSGLSRAPKYSPELANGVYDQFSESRLKSKTLYNAEGRQEVRFDLFGRPHGGVIPHVHVFYYNAEGYLCGKDIFNLDGVSIK